MYSTVKELHIALDIITNSINTNRRKVLYPEEKDFVLNLAVQEYVKTRSSGLNSKQQSFEQTIKRYDDLQELKVPTPSYLTLYKNTDDSVYGTLPSDYFQYIASRTYLKSNCKNDTLTESTSSVYYYVIPFPNANIQPYYDGYKLEISGTTLFDYGTSVMYNTEGKFEIVNRLIDEINNTRIYNVLGYVIDFSMYWEYYGNSYYPNSIVLVVNNTTMPIASLLVSGVSQSGTGLTPSFTLPVTSTKTTINYTGVDLLYKPNELVSSISLNAMEDNYYMMKNRENRPLVTLEDSVITIHHYNKFYPKTLELTYLRRPKLINYKTNQMSGLANNDEIVNIASKLIKLYLENPSYAMQKEENLTIE